MPSGGELCFATQFRLGASLEYRIVKKVVRRAELLKGHRQGFRRALD